jgi:phytoene dehydrogenase-like protein
MNSSPSLPEKVLIIGSGIGGLSTAIILAGLGVEVTVLEKNSQPGGLLRSYTRDGIECATGVHYLGSLGKGQVLRKFFDYLGVTDSIPVTRMGQDGIIDRYLFSSSTFDLPEGIDAYGENLKQAFPQEQAAIANIISSIHSTSRQLHELDILYTVENSFSLLDQAEPFGKILDGLHCSPGLRSILAIPSSWIGVPLSDCPAYYHNMALASYLSSSWRLNCSSSRMADALATRLRELGGKIITNAAVRAIKVESRIVRGVELESDEIISSSAVIGAVHPKVVLDMLPREAVKPSYRGRISNLINTYGIFSTHVRIDGEAHPEIPYNIFKVDSDANGNVPDLKYYQIRNCEKKGSSLLSILTSGKEVMWSPWLNTKTGRRGSEYLQKKEEHAAGLIQEAEELFGSFKGAKILDAYTPLTMRDWVNSPEGSAYGVQRSSSQILATALLNRTAVKGLSLAGQNVMAPGIIGTIMGSFSTVKLLLGADEFRRTVVLK